MRDYVVQVFAVEHDGEQVQTGIFGPLTEVEATGWARMFENMQKGQGVDNWRLLISQLDNPYTFGTSEELRQKPYGFSS